MSTRGPKCTDSLCVFENNETSLCRAARGGVGAAANRTTLADLSAAAILPAAMGKFSRVLGCLWFCAMRSRILRPRGRGLFVPALRLCAPVGAGAPKRSRSEATRAAKSVATFAGAVRTGAAFAGGIAGVCAPAVLCAYPLRRISRRRKRRPFPVQSPDFPGARPRGG